MTPKLSVEENGAWRDFRWRVPQGPWQRRQSLCALRRGTIRCPCISPFVLLVALLALLKVLFIREWHEHSNEHVLEEIEQSRCLDRFRLFGGLRNAHAVILAVRGLTKVLPHCPTDHRLVTAHVSSDLNGALASIPVDSLYQSSDEHIGPDRRNLTAWDFSLGTNTWFSLIFHFLWMSMTLVFLKPSQKSLQRASFGHEKQRSHSSALELNPGKTDC